MLEFGDIIYRPCHSYAGRKNFINTQIVKEIIHKSDEEFIVSYDVFGQGWTDRLEDLNKKIYTDMELAKNALLSMINEKKMYADDFNAVEVNPYGQFVRISEINEMIEYGAITVNREKLENYKRDTRAVDISK